MTTEFLAFFNDIESHSAHADMPMPLGRARSHTCHILLYRQSFHISLSTKSPHSRVNQKGESTCLSTLA